MKKAKFYLMPFLLCFFISSCSPGNTSSQPSSNISSSLSPSDPPLVSSSATTSTEPPPPESSAWQSSNTSSSPSSSTPSIGSSSATTPTEPPLPEFLSSIAVPSFLSEDQQNLYRKAHCLYEHMFGGDTTAIDTFVPDNAPSQKSEQYDEAELDGYTYLLSKGRYSQWDDFNSMIHHLFTDTFWNSRNNTLGDNQSVPIYRNVNGRLGMVELSRGSGYYYNENFPDEFRLDSKTENTIAFTLIGHYSPVWPKEGESSEECDKRRKQEYEYTIEFPIKMVLSDTGWKFDEFHSALADEDVK